MNVYIVEEDENIRQLVKYTLENNGMQTHCFTSSKGLFAALACETVDLILLDRKLPGEDGLAILSRLRAIPETRDIPVIMVTAGTGEMDVVNCLDEGADDYIRKPFGLLELLARVRAVTRRGRPRKQEERKDVLRCGQIQVNLQQHIVLSSEEEVALTKKEFLMLCYLLQHPNVTVTREEMLQQIWGTKHQGETRTIDIHINTLRKKLGSCGAQIETQRGVGYRITA